MLQQQNVTPSNMLEYFSNRYKYAQVGQK